MMVTYILIAGAINDHVDNKKMNLKNYNAYVLIQHKDEIYSKCKYMDTKFIDSFITLWTRLKRYQ